MTIGDRIKYLRKKHGITSTKLSQLTGITDSNIRKIETDKTSVTDENAKRIAAAFGVSTLAITGKTSTFKLETVGDLLGIIIFLIKNNILCISGDRGSDNWLSAETAHIHFSPIFDTFFSAQMHNDVKKITEIMLRFKMQNIFQELLEWEYLIYTFQKLNEANDKCGKKKDIECLELDMQSIPYLLNEENIVQTAPEPNECLFLAIAFDIDKDIEIDIIGDKRSVFEVISRSQNINDLSETDQQHLKIIHRKYGSLLFDLELLPKSNVLLQYIAMQTKKNHKYCGDKNNDVSNLIESFTMPFRTEKADQLINCFNIYRKDYYKIYETIFTEVMEHSLTSENTYYWSTSSGDIGFIATDYGLCTLYQAYINDCGRNHKILKRCKLCNSIMLGNVHNIGELCSEECRKKSRTANEQRFKKKLHSSEHEAAYHSLYRKLIYQKNKLAETGISDTDMFSFFREFKAFQAEMAEWRKTGTIKNNEDFSYWLNEWKEKLTKIIEDISEKGA